MSELDNKEELDIDEKLEQLIEEQASEILTLRSESDVASHNYEQAIESWRRKAAELEQSLAAAQAECERLHGVCDEFDTIQKHAVVLQDELGAARAECDEIRTQRQDRVECAYGRLEKQDADLERLRQELAAARAALKPFAEVAALLEDLEDTHSVMKRTPHLVSEYRAAAKAM